MRIYNKKGKDLFEDSELNIPRKLKYLYKKILSVFNVSYIKNNKIIFYTGSSYKNGDEFRFELFLRGRDIILSDGGQTFRYYIKNKDCSSDFENDFNLVLDSCHIVSKGDNLEISLGDYKNDVFKAIFVFQNAIFAIEKSPYDFWE